MTGAQASYLATLSEQVPPSVLSKTKLRSGSMRSGRSSNWTDRSDRQLVAGQANGDNPLAVPPFQLDRAAKSSKRGAQ